MTAAASGPPGWGPDYDALFPSCLPHLLVAFCCEEELPSLRPYSFMHSFITVYGRMDSCCIQRVVISALVISRFGQWKLLQAVSYILLKRCPRPVSVRGVQVPLVLPLPSPAVAPRSLLPCGGGWYLETSI